MLPNPLSPHPRAPRRPYALRAQTRAVLRYVAAAAGGRSTPEVGAHFGWSRHNAHQRLARLEHRGLLQARRQPRESGGSLTIWHAPGGTR